MPELFQHLLVQAVTVGTKRVSKPLTIEASDRKSLEVEVPGGAEDMFIEFDLDVSAVKSLFMNCTRDLEIDTNTAGAEADEEIELGAEIPYVWHDQYYQPLYFNNDITALYVTNHSNAPCVLSIEALVDPTP